MNQILLLEQETIDRIAAGEVVERPASIVKELVENSIDAGANAITVEIKEGGISLVRITDNGEGIPKEEVRTAFLRHATSKIRKVEDLLTSRMLGFRGEALSSIAAVCQVELITKTAGSVTGTRYVIEGGQEKTLEEIGAPEGTTFLVRNIFYHTPARKKFLKTPVTEAGYVSDLIERMALSNPGVSFKFIHNNEVRLHTSGNHNLRDIIYAVYGRETAANTIPLDTEAKGIHLSGFIGKPSVSRGNRSYENYFVNGRYVKNSVIARAIEEAYRPFLMNHRYPFTALMLHIDAGQVDVNVHPTKMEVRFADQQLVYQQVYEAIKTALAGRELIPEFTINTRQPGASDKSGVNAEKQPKARQASSKERAGDGSGPAKRPVSQKPLRFTAPEPFEKLRAQLLAEADSPYEVKYPKRFGTLRSVTGNVPRQAQNQTDGAAADTDTEEKNPAGQISSEGETAAGQKQTDSETKNPAGQTSSEEKTAAGQFPSDRPAVSEQEESVRKVPEELLETVEAETESLRRKAGEKPMQLNLFEEKFLDAQSRSRHRLIGQLFETYWLVEFDEKLYIIDQHAAHEKVMYEHFMENLAQKKQTSQRITPPLIVTLSMQEETLLQAHQEAFAQVGFEISHFGGKEYAIYAVPANLYGISDRTLFSDLLDSLADLPERASMQAVLEKVASMSCKAAVKGNNRLSFREADALIEELLTLENPYNCPHGRPTIIEMSKYELERKFKRIL